MKSAQAMWKELRRAEIGRRPRELRSFRPRDIDRRHAIGILQQRQWILHADEVFTCGCGHLSAELLCSLLLQRGIASILDVRELDPDA